MRVRVSDSGPGFDPAATGGPRAKPGGHDNDFGGDSGRGRPDAGGGLGLPGLRDRVESLGGNFDISSAPGRGARLSMTLDLDGGGGHD